MLTRQIVVGMLGWSAESIAKGATGLVWFPTGAEDPRFRWGFKWEKHRVKAIEEIRAHQEVVVVDELHNIKEHTPVEAKILGYIYDDYVALPYAAAEVPYKIGTQAHAADSAVPSNFIAELLRLTPTTNCLVRFEGDKRVQHLLLAGIQFTYERRCKIIYVQQQAPGIPPLGPGTLTVRALGNEVGI